MSASTSSTPIWDDVVAERAARGPLNPDCAQGKHKACAGDAWDLETDEPARCACPCHADDQAAAIAEEEAA